MTSAQLHASHRLWARRERKALLLWRSRQKRLDQDDPRRVAAFRAFREASAMVKKRARQIAALPIATVNAAGRAALIREEGVRRFAYNDSAGHATFGVGHLIHHGPVNAADRRRWGTPARPLSMRVVDSVLMKDLASYERVVRDAFRGAKLRPTANMFNACVSLAFNIGTGGFATSSVARHLKAGRKQAAANAFLLWDNPPELRGRRERERAMFLR